MPGQEVAVQENYGLDSQTVNDLTEMVNQSLKFYQSTSPIYEKIAKAVLEVFNDEKEIANLDHKDLFKLLELSQKAMTQPVEQLIKLVQNLTALHERSVLSEKMNSLAVVVNNIKDQVSSQSNPQSRPGLINVDDIDEDN